MRSARLLFLFVMLLCLVALAGFAIGDDDSSLGIIVYAEGDSITILRENAQLRLDAGSGEALGEPLYAGDQVTTDSTTFAEIQLLTSNNIVRIAESTTFVVETLSGSESALRVTYGRLRARVEQLTGAGRFQMRGLTAVAGVRGTDFGYDQIVDAATGELLDRIYCFDGEVEVSAAADPTLTTRLPAGTMLIARAETGPESIVARPLDDATARYWTARPFTRDIAAAETLADEFPRLRDRVESDLGALPRVLERAAAETDQEEPAAPEPEVAEAPPETPPVGESPAAPTLAERVEKTGSSEAERGEEPAAEDAAERGARAARGLRTTGVVLASVGLLADVAAVALYYFGDDLIPGWTADNNSILGPVAASGVGLLAGGIIAIMIGLGLNN